MSISLPDQLLTKHKDLELSITNDLAATQSNPFEGPEKLLEIWFTPSKDGLDDHPTRGTRIGVSNHPAGPHKLTGLRTINRETWDDMLKSVKCKILSVIENQEVDAYLLSESSMFVFPHKIILKTCGTTTLLLGLHRLLEIARDECEFPGVWRLFYSRKAYMFPERQIGPHKTWEQETKFLDETFSDSSAYTVGKTNGDHWFLYLTAQQHHIWPQQDQSTLGNGLSLAPYLDKNSLPKLWRQHASNLSERDCTLEILMTGLSTQASKEFYANDPLHPNELIHQSVEGTISGTKLATSLGIDAPSLIGKGETDAYLFSPCGFSANMIGGSDNQRYATIHVTPEQTHSFASFESNVDYSDPKENFNQVVSQIVNVFQPKKMSLTLFDSNAKNEESGAHSKDAKLLKEHLPDGYKRVDRIIYCFDGYDLIFLSFEREEHPHHHEL